MNALGGSMTDGALITSEDNRRDGWSIRRL